MQDKKEKLKEISNEIKNIKNYSDETAKDYVKLLEETLVLIKSINIDKDNTKLSTCVSSTFKDLKIEIEDRFDNHFFTMREQKKQNELNYSKLITRASLKSIIKCI
ncbi:MAG: hypothetical protein U9R42_07110 [Bacteroidota bacterium]|nr:hypothetical protein [Bacteroidota bacterium]